MEQQQLLELCNQTFFRNKTQEKKPRCDLMAGILQNVSQFYPNFQDQANFSQFEEENSVDQQEENKTTKLVVLTIIIFFTVVGNFGVVLAILLRRWVDKKYIKIWICEVTILSVFNGFSWSLLKVSKTDQNFDYFLNFLTGYSPKNSVSVK